ncbi:WYL domain-containing protein [Paenibacillus harenae]|uniref:DNA-binding transcriptional regulator YafY n=1 Tax=Paenibacillus harenae TaxID=306543 RepID=A0ABT9TWU0_PAEHA|nr:WYL domain-containing protein [Paenibacillus harenae]MDQ0111838.1 putative DNA-binding transcriptional regulator YafY [Paenibacillus harenae]
MNPFEKIFNYQIISKLDDSGTFMVTSHERSWLKTMLSDVAAEHAFTPETLSKLRSMLETDPLLRMEERLVQKARSKVVHVYHPLLRQLRRSIMSHNQITLSFLAKDGNLNASQSGIPYKLEYSMVKREWYLLWFHLSRRKLLTTRLNKIVDVQDMELPPSQHEQLQASIRRLIDRRAMKVAIEVVRQYNEELSRILYAFSCFDKKVQYDAETHIYTVHLTFPGEEQEYVLSKLRFLGKRVRIAESDYLKSRMLNTANMALERYGQSDP